VNPPFQRAVSPGIELRLLHECDADAVFAGVERNRAYLRQWLPWVDRTRSAAEIRQFTIVSTAQWEAGQGPNCSIWAGGAFVGCIGCHPIGWADRQCSLGYWLDAARQGEGIMTRACAAMLDYLFLELGLHRVEIRCGEQNAPSCAIPKRLGFRREGLLRDGQWVNDRWVSLVVWGILQCDWPGASAAVR
jgi:ribosomal-protein-serine acetyltransferase